MQNKLQKQIPSEGKNMHIRASKITTEDLVKEMLRLPQGWKKEIYIQNGFVKFSGEMTANMWSQDQSDVVGKIESLSFSEVEGIYEREDGKIELDVETLGESGVRKITKGEKYDRVEIISKEDAIRMIGEMSDNEEWYVSQLASRIREIAEMVHDEKISYVKAIEKMERAEA